MRRAIRSEETVTEVVIRAVADQTNRDPTDLSPLYDSVNPTALDALFSRTPCAGGVESVSLIHEGCHVMVDREAVTVEELPKRSKA